MTRAVTDFSWINHLRNLDFNNKILHIARNFMPNNYVKIQPKDHPWITNNLRRMIKKKIKPYKKILKNGCLPETKTKVDKFRNDCFNAINLPKNAYLDKMGTKLLDSKSCPKTYWQILNKILNKCRIPRIPPIISYSKLLINSVEKAQCFNKFFLPHCKTNVNNSILPALSYLADSRLGTIKITENEIKSIIMSLNPNKTYGCDNISIQMLQLCAEAIHIPLGIIFSNIVITGIFPDHDSYS